jgi:DnaJ-class molecular chaperone
MKINEKIEICHNCKGTGRARKEVVVEGGGTHGRNDWRTINIDCPYCLGSGRVIISTYRDPFVLVVK